MQIALVKMFFLLFYEQNLTLFLHPGMHTKNKLE